MAVTAARAFDELALLPWDELNIIIARKRVERVYSTLRKQAERCLLLAAQSAWDDAMIDILGAGYAKVECNLDMKWLTGFLAESNPVTQYIWGNEIDRKVGRLVEGIAVAAAHKDRNELKNTLTTAQNLWTRQINQYMIEVIHAGMELAYQQAGVTEVEWITMMDERVCTDCEEREGMIFPIDAIPKRHYRCRCYTIPVHR